MPPAPPDMRSVRRILIVKLSAIGDVVHSLPVSAALGEAFPDVEITWVVESMSAPMVTGNPYLHDVIVLPAEWRKQRYSLKSIGNLLTLRRMLRPREFDVALDLQGLSKSALCAWASGARYRYGCDYLRELAPYLVKRIPRQPESRHIVDQLLDVAHFLGAPKGPVKFPLHIPPEEADAAAGLLRDAGVSGPYAVINATSGGGGHKGWGAERFAALLDSGALGGLPAVLVGAKGDAEEAGRIISLSSAKPIDLTGRTNLKQLAALLRDGAIHVCGDTGSAHIAAALGTPTVSIFGRSDPERLAPYGMEQFALHHREKCAAPCRRFHETAPINRKQKCFAPPPICLASVTVEEVAATVREAVSTSHT